jgi:hypothetical protein
MSQRGAPQALSFLAASAPCHGTRPLAPHLHALRPPPSAPLANTCAHNRQRSRAFWPLPWPLAQVPHARPQRARDFRRCPGAPAGTTPRASPACAQQAHRPLPQRWCPRSALVCGPPRPRCRRRRQPHLFRTTACPAAGGRAHATYCVHGRARGAPAGAAAAVLQEQKTQSLPATPNQRTNKQRRRPPRRAGARPPLVYPASLPSAG